ncbi:hypothetical protein K438DRAFT_1780251 [Mycena galopus ATCC 62051]|nr:hypothetical protein K438DRAFT_1780251 [Mycena galopus ATCC 62051]
MVNNRKPVAVRKVRALLFHIASITYFQPIIKNLRSCLYSTAPDGPRVASTPTHIEKSNPNTRYPLVESHFLDAAHQPWIHDFRIRLEHGQKVSRFRIFLKRGKALAPNAYANNIKGDIVLMRIAAADNASVVNMRRTDFQSATHTQPPKELVVHRAQAFPGSP